MFNDEDPIALKKMHGLTTVDGFVEINENLSDMIKFVANEPSVGLFYVQQHSHNATPNLLNLKNKVGEKSRETALHTEDLVDSISMLRSMKECGFPIADEMIGDIKRSLSIISSKRGSMYNSSPSFLSRTASWGRNAVFPGDDRGPGYLSSALKSMKQRAYSFNQAQTGSEEASRSKNPSELESEDEQPLTNEVGREVEEESHMSKSLSHQQLLALSEHYDEFKADREAKLEEWLGGRESMGEREMKNLERKDV